MSPRAFWILTGLAALAACNAMETPSVPPQSATAAQRGHLRLPAELLYVLGGSVKTRTPHILVFDGQERSRHPAPIYTIPPDGNGEYGLLAVDHGNYLFAEQFLSNAVKLYMFPPGQTKPSVTCVLPWTATAMYVAKGRLYLAGAGDTIEEFAEPLTSKEDCEHPIVTLTDKLALHNGSPSLYALTMDRLGNIFDTWQGGRYNYFYMDKFPAGSKNAQAFAGLHDAVTTFYMTSDRSSNLITNLYAQSGYGDALAVFPRGSKVPKLFQPIPDGTYCGVAIATQDTELFALKDYPSTVVSVYHYFPNSGTIGTVKRTFPGLWPYAQSIAVYSP